ncbi:MAG: feruloyl-CoA synthase [Beijerinckiaceae bacterium]|nr:MAG: feruloyl-CoA synthase [Beijerinckiaceae bacterium]
MLARSPTAPLRAVDFGSLALDLERQPNGVIRARSPLPLPAFDKSVTARLEHWASLTPERVFLAERDQRDGWQTLTFAAALAGARALGQALLDRSLDAQRPLVILSGNSIPHALLALAALYVGIPYAPVSPAYALLSRDFSKLKQIIALLTPGLVFADDWTSFASAIAAAVPEHVEVATDFGELLATTPAPEVDAVHARASGDTIAKILFTSGSTAEPKAVITTHRMLCANQTMIEQALPFLRDEPPVLADWLPWHHSFGGNHNFGIALHHGGTLYIDHGRPTDSGMAETLRTLGEISPTLYFNVPKGFEMLLTQLEQDRRLAENFFRRLKLNFFAGAPLPDRTADRLDAIAIATCGERIATISGYGATETAPSILFQTDQEQIDPVQARAGLPLPGNELKLVPIKGEVVYEARVRGPNVTPGYWRNERLTREAFDEEGFFRLGDALALAEEKKPQRGFVFAGRIGEDFKLANGTTARTAALRRRLMEAGTPYIRDAVIAGAGRDAVTALIFPDLAACRAAVGEAATAAPDIEILSHPKLRGLFHAILSRLAADAGGASAWIAGLALLEEPASIDAGEITDKGTLNPRAVLGRRAKLVDTLYEKAAEEVFAVVVEASSRNA